MSSQRLQRGGTAARSVPTLRFLRGVGGRDVRRRPAGVSAAGPPHQREPGAEEELGRRAADCPERVGRVRKETGRVDQEERTHFILNSVFAG